MIEFIVKTKWLKIEREFHRTMYVIDRGRWRWGKGRERER